jgi:biofilm PGA synthesis N-glycosyltransferase PgaC
MAAVDVLFRAAVVLFVLYPVVTALMWMSFAIVHRIRLERGDGRPPAAAPGSAPRVSVVVPAFAEEHTIEDTLSHVLALDYPDLEVIVVDDASPDGLVDRVVPFLADPRVRLVEKSRNEGKSLAVNDGVACAGGDIVVVLDADTRPAPDSLRRLVPHFEDPTVAAVTGNPLVRHSDHLLVRMQAIEFAGVIGLIRRTHQLWGSPLTVTGAFTAFRRTAFEAVGGFDPAMETEDIAITWRLQLEDHRILFEPRATAFVVSPETLPKLWRQRRRWAKGLGEVVHEHGAAALRRRAMLPLLVEVALSVTWAVGFTVALAIAALSWVLPFGEPTPLIAWWGVVIALVALAQSSVAVALAHRYDPGLWRLLPASVVYVLGVWAIGSLTATLYAVPAIVRGARSEGSVRWGTLHREARGQASA